MATREERTNVRVGLTVIAGLILLLGGIALAKGWHFGSRPSLQAEFPTAGGLELGDPVTVNGIKRGSVSDIQLVHGDVLVTMEFAKLPDLRRDAEAEISMLELMGGKKIEILSGSAADPLPKGQIIKGKFGGDISSLVSVVNSQSDMLRSLAGKADTLFTSLNHFFGGRDFSGNLNGTLRKAQNSLSGVDRTLHELSVVLRETREPLQRTLATTETAVQNLNSVLGENRSGLRMFIDSTNFAIREARLMLSQTDKVIRNIDSAISGGEKTLIYRLTRDTTFVKKLDSMITSLYKLSEQIRTQGVDANIRFFNSSKPK